MGLAVDVEREGSIHGVSPLGRGAADNILPAQSRNFPRALSLANAYRKKAVPSKRNLGTAPNYEIDVRISTFPITILIFADGLEQYLSLSRLIA
jgi:hypothetical protein